MATSSSTLMGFEVPERISKRYGRIFGIVLGLASWYALATILSRGPTAVPIEALQVTWGMVAEGTFTEHLLITGWWMIWRIIALVIVSIAMGTIIGLRTVGK